MNKKKKELMIVISYGLVLCLFTTYVLLKTFVIKDAEVTNVTGAGIYAEDYVDDSDVASDNSTDGNSNNTHGNRSHGSRPSGSHHGKSNNNSDSSTSDSSNNNSDNSISDSSNSNSTSSSNLSYSDDNISITISEIRKNDTTVYIADVEVSSMRYLKTAFADNTYGRNIKDTTSDIAKDNNAILAINGDYYGFRDYGYVIRNGVLYRDTAGDGDCFVIYEDGNCDIVSEADYSASSLLSDGVVQCLSFGPGLIKDGEIIVDTNTEVAQSMSSNPRTAIGMINPLHYIFVVSDGRTTESAGLSIYELAEVMQEYGCSVAYNLDGGGSTTMYFNGEVINNPTTNGNKISEREVSDIVYIGK